MKKMFKILLAVFSIALFSADQLSARIVEQYIDDDGNRVTYDDGTRSCRRCGYYRGCRGGCGWGWGPWRGYWGWGYWY